MTTTTVHRQGAAHCSETVRREVTRLEEVARLTSIASDYGNAYKQDPDRSEGCLYEARRLKRIADALLTEG